MNEKPEVPVEEIVEVKKPMKAVEKEVGSSSSTDVVEPSQSTKTAPTTTQPETKGVKDPAEPKEEVYFETLRPGDGVPIKPNATVAVHYAGRIVFQNG